MGDIRSHFRFRFLFLRGQIKLPIVPNCGWEGEPQFPARKKFHHPLSGWTGWAVGSNNDYKEHFKYKTFFQELFR
jgi:hypothetical protein